MGGAAYKCREGEIGAEKRCREWNGERVRPIDLPVGPLDRMAWRSTAAAQQQLGGREPGGFAAEKRRSGGGVRAGKVGTRKSGFKNGYAGWALVLGLRKERLGI